jgi:hypothetical protein
MPSRHRRIPPRAVGAMAGGLLRLPLRAQAAVAAVALACAAAQPPPAPSDTPRPLDYWPCDQLDPGGLDPAAAFWNASAQHSSMFYDSVTDGLYLWPHAIAGASFAVTELRTRGCLRQYPSPWDPTAPNGTSRFLLRRNAADAGGSAWSDGRSALLPMSGTPAGAFFTWSTVWMPERRQLFAFGGAGVWDAAPALPPPRASIPPPPSPSVRPRVSSAGKRVHRRRPPAAMRVEPA